ncbi:MAG: glutamyl-tRNA reductase [bacterium]
MSILIVGVNHRTAPVELREHLAFSRQGIATALLMFRRRHPETEAALLSTCNRVELIVAASSGCPSAETLVRFLAEAKNLSPGRFCPHLYQHCDQDAVRHLFRVTSGLDSMVVGENQIVNQVKQAYTLASEQNTAGPILNRLFHQAFAVSKQIRNDTRICEGHTSIAALAVETARRHLPETTAGRILVIGAGEMAQLVCEYLSKGKHLEFLVTSRTEMNARALAEACHGTAVSYAELDRHLAEADIVISATNCPTHIVTVDRVRSAQKRQARPRLIVDLAVPRDVEPGVSRVADILVCDIDALGRQAARNHEQRANEMSKCERMLDDAVSAFDAWRLQSYAKPLIQQLYGDADTLADLEITRLLNRCSDLTESQRQAITETANRLVKKLMHPLVQTVRHHGDTEPTATFARTLRDMAQRQRSSGEERRATTPQDESSAVAHAEPVALQHA